MAQIDFFNQLKGRLKNARSQPPVISTAALGFTGEQMMKMNLKRPRLIWYDAMSKKFYDQGDSTKIKKSDWMKINSTNFKKDKPIDDLRYYIPIDAPLMQESTKHQFG